MSKPIYTNEQVIEQIANMRMYAGDFTYSFEHTDPDLVFSNVQKAAATEAFNVWNDLIPINITEAPAGSSGAGLWLRNTYSNAYAAAYQNGVITVSNQYADNLDPQNGNYGMLTLIHEIGHALGLDHPGPYNGGGTYADDAVYYQDTRQYTVMSYFDATNTGANHGGYYPSTPMLHDILAIQFLYGVDTTTRTDDTVYGFNSTAGRSAFQFDSLMPPVVCIWDAGGQDKLDVSGYSMNQLIDLRQGSFSDIGGLVANVSIAYGADIENATAGTGADLVQGNNLNNILLGGAGNDTLVGFAGANTLDGGSGIDTVDYSWAASAVKVNISIATGVATGVSTDKYLNLDNIIGSAYGDTLTGTNGSNVINGGAGADNINGNAGADTLQGGAGSDYIYYDVADTLIDGGSDGDTLRVLDAQTVNLANLADQVVGGGIVQGFENVTASGNTASISITGSESANSLTGGNAADTIIGAGGDDTISGAGNDILLDGGAGIDTLKLTSAININLAAADQSVGGGVMTGFENVNASAVTTVVNLTGDGQNNNLITGLAADTLLGGSGNDSITADFADTLVNGEAGEDTLKLVAGFNVDLSNSADHTVGGGIVTGFEHVDATGVDAAITITGSAAANKITGGKGADTLLGNSGNDTIAGDSGDTLLDGGAGKDTLKLAGAMNINLSSASDQSVGGGVARNFENINATAITTTLVLTGSAAVNSIQGGSGADTIDALAGADTVYGNAGNDTIYYDVTDTVVDGGSNSDTLVLTLAAVVNLANAVDQVIGGGIATGFENVSAWGSAAAFNMTGDSNVNILTGGNGADTLQGGEGNDIILGNAGDILLAGDAGIDTLRLTANYNIDLSNAADQLIGVAVATGFENIDANTSLVTAGVILSGDMGINNIQGGVGADTINGRGGADILMGNGGNDILYFDFTNGLTVDGGAGSDTLKLIASTYVSVDLSNIVDHVASTGTALNFENVDASATLGGISLTGNSAANALTGGEGLDYIVGGGGADTLYGMGGDDTFIYDVSDTVVDGGSGEDALNISIGAIINLSNTTDQISGGGLERNIENVFAYDVLTAISVTGSSANNKLVAGQANDSLSGLGGSDELTGGMGADRFIFTKATAFTGLDMIWDFSTSQSDILDIADLLIGFTINSLNIDQFVNILPPDGGGFGFPTYMLQVDLDGVGTSYAFQDVTKILSFETFTATSLYNSGLLDVVA